MHPCAMVNIVGDKTGAYQLKYMKELMRLDGVYIHLYGKKRKQT